MIKITPNQHLKIYLILIFISLTFLFLSTWLVRPVIVEPFDAAGLISHLPLGYWIGLALLLITSILAFLDRDFQKDATYIIILLALGLFFMGVTLFVYQNAVNPEIYYPFGEVRTLLALHHVLIGQSSILATYSTWPAFDFLSAALLNLSGLKLGEVGQGFVKFVPLFFILCFIFITYSLGKRLKLAPNHCFLLSFLSLSSWLVLCEYNPRDLGILLYILLFMLLITHKKTVAENAMAIAIFSALVLSHGLSAIVVIPGAILLGIFKRNYTLPILFICIFAAWYIYQAEVVIGFGITQWLKPLIDIIYYTNTSMYSLPSSIARILTRYSMLTYVAVFGILTLGSLIMIFFKKINKEQRKQIIFVFCWSIPIGLFALGGYQQIILRSYYFLIIPAACITVLSFSKWRVPIVALMIICTMLYLPANYAAEVSGQQILTTEIKGTEFFATVVQPDSSYYYGYSPAMIYYYDPELIQIPVVSLNEPTPNENDFSILDNLRFVIISKQGSDSELFAWGVDPIASWPETEAGKKADLIYNNSEFQIYLNYLQ